VFLFLVDHSYGFVWQALTRTVKEAIVKSLTR